MLPAVTWRTAGTAGAFAFAKILAWELMEQGQQNGCTTDLGGVMAARA